jgi:hypothetical protein
MSGSVHSVHCTSAEPKSILHKFIKKSSRLVEKMNSICILIIVLIIIFISSVVLCREERWSFFLTSFGLTVCVYRKDFVQKHSQYNTEENESCR